MNELFEPDSSGLFIAPMDRDEVIRRAETIRPVVRHDDSPHYISAVDLFEVAYTWDPKPTKKAEHLKEIQKIRTYHGYGYYGLFKPSCAEVLAQIPKSLLGRVVAFEIIEWPQTADDLNKEMVALNAGFHVATTMLYERIETP